jgi:ribose transport system permease protein
MEGRKMPAIKKKLLNTQTVVLIVAVGMWVFLTIFNPRFIGVGNVQNIMRQMAIQGILGVAEVLVILTAGIDLSVGSVVAFINVMMSQMIIAKAPLPLPLILFLCLFSAALIGLCHGVLVFDFRLPPFIATLGTMTILRGVVFLLTGGRNIFGLPRSIADFGVANFPVIFIKEVEWGIPYLFWILIVTVLVIELVLRRTSFGRYVYALGSNPEAARLSGVNTRVVTYGVYALASLLAGVAGLMETTRLWMGVPGTGSGYELDGIAAAILGGTSFAGAEGTPAGAFVGALVMTTIYNGAIFLKIDPFWTRIVVGGIIIATVAVDQVRRRKTGE